MGERTDDIGAERDEPITPYGRDQEIAGRNAEQMRENLSSAANRNADMPVVTSATSADDYVIEEQSNPESAQESTDQSAAEIRGDIEDTRARMGSTIDAIQDKLSPQNLMEQAKETVRDATVGRAQEMVSNVADTARETGSTLMDTIRQNPVPVALTAIGLGWLLFSTRRESAQRREWEYRYGRRGAYDDRYYRGGYRGANGAYQPQRQTDSRMEQMTDRIQDTAAKAGNQMQEVAGNVADKAGDMADYAQFQAQRAQGWLERTWDENPLLLAGGAVLLGTMVGLAVPETPFENRMMGEARDNLVQKAQEVAQDTVQRAQSAASNAANQMADRQPQRGNQQTRVEKGSQTGH